MQGFLQKLQDTKVKQEVQLRYEVLSYYDLGEKIYFEGEDNEDDYQLSEFDNYGKSRKFKYCCDISEDDYKVLEETIESNKKIVAIGEIGLDYHWNKENKDKQREVFRRQLSLAEKFNLPVVIHTRDAIEETYEILKEYKVRGVMHCFSGSYEMAKKFISLGFLLGIGGVVTFKNSKLYQVIEKVTLDNIVLETDSPYMAPEPVRGTTNESANIPYIAERIAKIKKISTEEVGKITTRNACMLFDLDSNL